MKTPDSAFYLLPSALKWLPDMDLNHDKQIQSLLCYRYTIGQTRALKVECPPIESRLDGSLHIADRSCLAGAQSSSSAWFIFLYSRRAGALRSVIAARL